MVSGTRCPAWSDKLKKWSESRAAAPKDRCPVGHRGEFPYVLIGQDFGLRGHISGQRAREEWETVEAREAREA